MTIKEQLEVSFRIRRAVCAISEKSPSYARSVIDQFLKFIAPSMASGNGVDFPFTCRRHTANPENAAHGTNGKWPTLYFHIGNAILGFYDGVKGIQCPGLEARITLLERIGRQGMDAFRVDGDDMNGYQLNLILTIARTEDQSHELSDSESVQGGVHDPGGSTGVRVPGSPLLLRS